MSDVRAAIQRAADLFASGHKAEALAEMEACAARWPRDADVRYNLAMVLGLSGRFADAKREATEGTRLAPGSAEMWGLYAQACVQVDDRAESERAAREAARLEPANADRLRGVAWILHRLGRFTEAAEWAQKGLALSPRDADLWLKRAVAIQCMGRTDEAFDIYKRGSAACPDSIDLAEGHANCATYCADLSATEVLATHKKFGALVERGAFGAKPPAVDRAAGQTRPLRVGLLSGDLRGHSVANFARSLIEHHAAGVEGGVELHVFHYGSAEDEVSARLRALVPHGRWHHAVMATPEEIDARVRGEKIDVLIETAGLTRGHHLRVMARRPAPLLATYMGYANTTGMRVIDLRIVDSLTDPVSFRTPPSATPIAPPGGADADGQAVERLVRIDPCFLCYSPPTDTPPVAGGPGSRGGPLTFGSFNTITKVNDFTLALWKRVLDAVPGSRLVVKSRGLEDASVRDDVARRVSAAGFEAGRVDLLGRIDERAGHLAAYERMDIALDPFPYHGTTTTCEALLMAVPVVTLAGQTHASRVGVSLLTNTGLGEWIARTPEEYVDVAVRLAGDAARLEALRGELRGRLLGSVLCDGPAFAARFFGAIGREWDAKCGRR
ncbi:MAG: tetratricopeptide repeat protein [Phycisphaerales bacterium]